MKKLVNKALLVIGYLALMLPMCLCIYYSVPASDDFAAATRRNGQSLLSQSARHGFEMWWTWGGRWLSQFVQTLINPLNSHQHLGHKYGIYMIVMFIVTTVMIIYGLYVCVKRVLGSKSKYIGLVTFIIMAMFYSTYYYSECYNWYIGAMVYTVAVGFLMIAIAAMIKYADSDTTNNIQYAIMILAGIFPATIEYCDVAIGITYVYFIYYCCLEQRKTESIKNKIKNVIPLVIYVILGVTNVFAPGNKIRQEYYHLDLSVSKSFIQYVKDVVIRIQDIIVDHPFAVLLSVILFFIGIASNKEREKETKFVELIVLFAIITTGSLFPYIYGRAFENNYLDIRMEYVLDMCLMFGFGILVVKLGRLLAYKASMEFNAKEKLFIIMGLCMYTYVSILQNYAYLDIVQIDILRNKGNIAASYKYWDGVLSEIENSSDDNVIIERDEEPIWSRYFLPVGLIEGDIYDVDYNKIYDEELIMPNVYYEKKSIEYRLNNSGEQK